MTDIVPAERAAPWSGPKVVVVKKPFRWTKLLPFLGPVALFILWDIVVRAGWIKAILLPTPSATLAALFTGLAGGPLLADFGMTVLRTVEAFLIAAFVGVPLGVLLGSNERAYRSVEFLIDFFRSTPSSARPVGSSSLRVSSSTSDMRLRMRSRSTCESCVTYARTTSTT